MWRQIFSWNYHRSIIGKTNTIVNHPLGNEISKRRKKIWWFGGFFVEINPMNSGRKPEFREIHGMAT
jgi:hypothetical protein